MEIEAKFAIPDHDTAERLKRAVRLGPFAPGDGVTLAIRDQYIDAATRALHQAGYACRFREWDGLPEGQRTITLKGLGLAESAIHQRFESELPVRSDVSLDPTAWPEWEGRELVLSTIGDQPLVELFAIEQVRHSRELYHGERLVGEMCVDEGRILAGSTERRFLILELELTGEGTMQDLETVVEHLTSTWGLTAELRSKFEMGLALLEGDRLEGADGALRLRPEEREQLTRIAEGADDQGVRKRAQLFLEWDKGASIPQLVVAVDYSRSWVYELLRRFREGRMSLFPAELAKESPDQAADNAPLKSAAAPSSTDLPSASKASQTATLGSLQAVRSHRSFTVEELSEQFHVDSEHAHRVAEHALSLFDATASLHKLGDERRQLLRVMALLHNVGLETDPDRHHVSGRDIILEHPVEGLSDTEQRMVASAAYLHRRPIKRKRLRAEVVRSLPPGIRDDTLTLAALVRIADGLDYSQTQATVVDEVVVSGESVHVSVSGPSAQVDADRAQRKADLWERVSDLPFFVSVKGSNALEATATEQPPEAAEAMPLWPSTGQKEPGVLPYDTMAEAGRKVLYFHFLRLLQHESGTRRGEDIEELHDMRVATRRMRSALRVFGKYYKSRAIRPYVAGLRRTARALGAVRDLDVLMEKAQRYLKGLPEEQRHDLDPLLEVWQAQRRDAREDMLAYLDSDRYQDFIHSFRLFLETPGAGARKSNGLPPQPTLVRHVLPRLIYTRWAAAQAFELIIDDAPVPVLHALRIECKRLRYVLEFFVEVLGPEATDVIAEVVRLQDHLGDLHDADVANDLLSDFLFGSRNTSSSERVLAPGVVTYLAAKQRELQTLIETFPQRWEQFNRPEVRRWLASAVAVL